LKKLNSKDILLELKDVENGTVGDLFKYISQLGKDIAPHTPFE
jgi:hypothetical protein